MHQQQYYHKYFVFFHSNTLQVSLNCLMKRRFAGLSLNQRLANKWKAYYNGATKMFSNVDIEEIMKISLKLTEKARLMAVRMTFAATWPIVIFPLFKMIFSEKINQNQKENSIFSSNQCKSCDIYQKIFRSDHATRKSCNSLNGSGHHKNAFYSTVFNNASMFYKPTAGSLKDSLPSVN